MHHIIIQLYISI